MTGFIGLLQVELDTHTAYLTDAGFITFNGNVFSETDSVLGSVASIDGMEEGASGSIPALDLSFNIPNAVSITTLTKGSLQRQSVKLWTADYDPATNSIVGTPRLEFNGQLDQPVARYGRGEFALDLSVVSKVEWFFNRDTGNGLSPAFHKSLYAGEEGHDNATGLDIKVAWGVSGPAKAYSSGGGGRGGSGGTFNPGIQRL